MDTEAYDPCGKTIHQRLDFFALREKERFGKVLFLPLQAFAPGLLNNMLRVPSVGFE